MTSPDQPVPFKRCNHCTSWLPLQCFGADRLQPDQRAKECRDCRRMRYRRMRTQHKLRDAKNHQSRRAEHYRARFEALIAALPDRILDRLPDDLFVTVTPMQRRVARAAHRKRTAGLPVRY